MSRPASTRPHEPASASSPDKPSPLLRLPDELLHAILDDLSLGDVKMCLDACRRLRAVAARRVFTAIRITDEADLLALATHFKHGCYVQSLKIDLEETGKVSEEKREASRYHPFEFHPDEWLPYRYREEDHFIEEISSRASDSDSDEEPEPVEAEVVDLGSFTWTEPVFDVDQDFASSDTQSDDESHAFAAVVQQILRSMPSLAYLSLRSLDWSEYAEFLSDRATPHLKNLVSLELGFPEWYRSTLAGLKPVQWWPLIAGLPNLKRLAFDDCFEICRARDAEEQITAFPSVEEVDIICNSRALL
ncbi:hypothetical protein BMF94_4136 [Rhodotorula taiwanensis]|uniref:F-box domain-containing protein n=1 Tax=Rhodotorula taiwanensis TaxID=741276 RepID=A0A2S5B7I3_9BASI|nr:hypothetical protein BMF94_4136 [Rhodotorula taiwanensis]